MSDLQITPSTSLIQEQRTVARQDAFAALVESLRREAPAPKPIVVAGVDALDEMPADSELLEIPCHDCGGNGFDSGSWDPFGDICPHCMGSGKEPLLTSVLPPMTVPAMIGAGGPIARRGVVSIGPGMFARPGRRAK